MKTKTEFFTPNKCNQCEKKCKAEINIIFKEQIEREKNAFSCTNYVKPKKDKKKGT